MKALIALERNGPSGSQSNCINGDSCLIFGEFFYGIGNAVRQKPVIEKARVDSYAAENRMKFDRLL